MGKPDLGLNHGFKYRRTPIYISNIVSRFEVQRYSINNIIPDDIRTDIDDITKY